jgi:N-acetylneuraminic acid mutarotase
MCSFDNYPAPGYCETQPFRRLFRYNPVTNSWATKRPAPHYHRHGAGGVINGKFYVVGGIDDRQRPVAALDRYDPATDTWQTLAPLPVGGTARGAVLHGKLIVIVSKFPGALQPELHTFAYNPGTNTWSRKASPKWEHDAVVQVTLNGRAHLLAVGGARYSPTTAYEAELYTP